MFSYRTAFVFTLWTMVLYGAIDAMRSATGPLLQAQTHISYAALGTLFAANSIGYLVGSLPSGFVLHKVGLKRTVLHGTWGMGIGLILLPFMHAYVLYWAAFFVYGLAQGWLEIGINAIIPAVTTTSRAESTGFNLLHGFYGVGATAFPIVVIWIATKTGSWGTPFYVIGAISILATLVVVGYHFPNLEKESNETSSLQAVAKHPQSSALSSPLFYALVIGIMLYVIAEGGTAAWLPTYLVHGRSMSVSESSWYLTGFYLVFTIGRLTSPLWTHRLGSYQSIIWSSIFSIILFSLALVVPNGGFLFIVSGLGFAVTFPTIVHIASQAFAHETGRVLGVLFTCAGIGGISVSWVIGLMATAYSIRIAFWVIPAVLALVLVATFMARFFHSHATSQTTSTAHQANL